VWQALSAVDGHTIRGAFSFAVGPAGSAAPPAEAFGVNAWEVWLRRFLSAAAGWLHLGGPVAAGGILLFWLVIEPRSRKVALRPEGGGGTDERGGQLARAVAGARRLLLLSLAAGLLQVALEVLDLAGSARDLLGDPALVRAYLSTRSGQGAVDRGLVLVASLAFLRAWEGPSRAAWPLWLVAGIQAISLWTVSLASHAAAATEGALLPVMLDWLHLLAATVWAGGLAALWHLAWTPSTRGAVRLRVAMARFTPWAAGAVLVLLGTGIYAISLHAPEWWNLPGSAYGRILLAKLTLVGAMVMLGMGNSLAAHPAWTARLGQVLPFVARWTGRPGGKPRAPASRARRRTAAEAALGVAVLGLAVVLSRTPPPKAALPPPPPPLTLEGPAGNLRVTLTITSPLGWLAPSRFRVQLQGREGPPNGVSRVTVHLAMPDMIMPVQPIVAKAVGAGEYEGEAFLSMLGRWQAQVAVRRGSREDVRTVFDFGVRDLGPTADLTSLSHTRADLGFHWSTLFLMAMPYVIVGSLGGWLLYMHRRAKRQRR
jgi:copper transport protein